MVSPQDTYEAGPNGNEVLGPNPGTNILTTNHIHEHSAASKTWSRLKWHGCWTQLNKRSIIDFVIPQEIFQFKKKEEGRFLPWKQLGWHENRPFKKSRYIVVHFPSWQLMNIGQFSSQPRIWQESKPLGTAPAAIHFPWKSVNHHSKTGGPFWMMRNPY